jgi:quercetin dioxygenase-like cupin family protein
MSSPSGSLAIVAPPLKFSYGEIMTTAPGVTIVGRADGHSRPLDLVEGEGTAEALVWPGMGARHRSMHRFELGAGARTLPQRHDGEAVYYVVDGAASILDLSTGDRAALGAGCMVHVDPDTTYRFEATLPAVLVGGPCPPDPATYDGWSAA